jgi:hypothetical protein
MTDLKLSNVEGWKTKFDPSGKLMHEKIGIGDLVFSNNHMQFADIVIPYQQAEDPKLHLDRAYFRHWIRFDTIHFDTQYSFGMRAKIEQLKDIPLRFNISVNRRIWFNLFMAYMVIQVAMFILWLTKRLLH